MKRKNKAKTLAVLALVSSLATTHATSVEVMTGKENTTHIAKVAGDITKKVGFFNKNKVTVDYKNKVSPFALADISYKLGKGIEGVFETQAAPGMGVVPRLGMSYFAKPGNFAIYLLSTINMIGKHDASLVASGSYEKRVSDAMKFVVSSLSLAEYVDGHFSFGSSENRVGLSKGTYKFGGALNTKSIKGSRPTYNPGLFVEKKF